MSRRSAAARTSPRQGGSRGPDELGDTAGSTRRQEIRDVSFVRRSRQHTRAASRPDRNADLMDPFDFSTGTTNPETFPTDALAEAAARAVRSHGVELNTYPGSLGHEGLRKLMAQRELDREGVRVDPDRIALTNGFLTRPPVRRCFTPTRRTGHHIHGDRTWSHGTEVEVGYRPGSTTIRVRFPSATRTGFQFATRISGCLRALNVAQHQMVHRQGRSGSVIAHFPKRGPQPEFRTLAPASTVVSGIRRRAAQAVLRDPTRSGATPDVPAHTRVTLRDEVMWRHLRTHLTN